MSRERVWLCVAVVYTIFAPMHFFSVRRRQCWTNVKVFFSRNRKWSCSSLLLCFMRTKYILPNGDNDEGGWGLRPEELNMCVFTEFYWKFHFACETKYNPLFVKFHPNPFPPASSPLSFLFHNNDCVYVWVDVTSMCVVSLRLATVILK